MACRWDDIPPAKNLWKDALFLMVWRQAPFTTDMNVRRDYGSQRKAIRQGVTRLSRWPIQSVCSVDVRSGVHRTVRVPGTLKFIPAYLLLGRS